MKSVIVSEVVGANTEDELIEQARHVMSSCNWQLGMIAANWTRRFSQGRTDAAFGELIGLSADQVYQRRRVWETFADVYLSYPSLKWSHFCVALTWDDAAACLGWAEEQQATVGEMRAWRRAVHGEDLSQDWSESEESTEESPVADREDVGSRGAAVSIRDIDGESERSPESAPYAPFSKTARSPERSTDAREGPAPESPDLGRIGSRLAKQLAACVELMSPELITGFDSLSEDTQEEVTRAIDQLAARSTMLPIGR